MLVHLERVWQDLRHGARVFARNPGLTAIAVVSIAFGTGANVAMFSVADTMLLRPLPVARPSELLAVGFKVETLPGVTQSRASWQEYEDLRARARSFEGLLAYDFELVGVATRAGDAPRVRFASFVSHDYFSVLGIAPPVGRGFHADEAARGTSARVVILADSLWRAEYGGDPSVVGKTLRIGSHDFTIIGVAPPTFTGLHPFVREWVYLPAAMLPVLVDDPPFDVLESRDARVFGLKGRLRPGASLAEARAELDTIAHALEQEHPATNRDLKLVAQTELAFKLEQRPLDASMILLLVVLSVAVLCVACANVAGLLASRAPVRAREMSLRLAVGANRGRLVRQLLTESLAVAIFGGAAGLLVAQIGIVILRGVQFPTEMIAPPAFELDRRALVVSLAVAMSSALLAGLWPALQMTRVDLASAIKTSDQSPERSRRMPLRALLVSLQVALSLVLMTIAAFVFQTFWRELHKGPGFRTTQMAKLTIDTGQAGYSQADALAYFSRVLEDSRRVAGVRSASVTSAMPLFSRQVVPVTTTDASLPDPLAGRPVWASSVDDRYFETMGIPLLAGRAFTPADDGDAATVAIVNTVLARHLWGDASPIGERLQILDDERRWVTVVGVVQPNTYGFAGERPQDGIFFPYLQRPSGQMVLLAHTDGPSTSVLEPLRAVAQRPDPSVPVFDAQTIERFYSVLVTMQLGTVVRMIGGIGLMGMVLTMVGLYGLVSFAVTRRTREIGIRIAIGATPRHVIRMVMRQGMAPVWLGLIAGLVLSFVAASTVLSYVPTGHQVGLMTYLLVVPLVIGVTTVAAALPARYAARISPTVALRCE
jgi:predicted permease